MQETEETGIWSLHQEDPLEEKWQPTPVSLPGKFHGPRSLVGYSPRYHCCSVASSCPPLLQDHGLQPTRLLCLRDFPGKNTGVVCHFLLQGIFSTQGLNPSQNLHCRQSLDHWVTKEVPKEKKSGFAVLCLSSSTSFDSTCEFLGTIKC